MNQIWFGLIWINPKESKTQRKKTKKQIKEKKQFSRLAWTCLDPSSPQNIDCFCVFYSCVFFVFLVLGD